MVISFRGQGTCLHTVHEKIPARNWIHAHAQDFVMSDELLLAIPKAFVPLVNKQLTTGSVHSTSLSHLRFIKAKQGYTVRKIEKDKLI
jgi:hypothetical protein